MAVCAVTGFKMGLSSYQHPKTQNGISSSKTQRLKLGFSSSQKFKSLKYRCVQPSFTQNADCTLPIEKLATFDGVYLMERMNYANFFILRGGTGAQRQNFTVAVVLPGKDWVLEQKIDEINQISLGMDPKDLTTIVLNEVVPDLLDTARHWVFSRLIVAQNFNESLGKLIQSDNDPFDILYPDPFDKDPIPEQANASHTPCTQVLVDVYTSGVIDYKIEGISTREDLKVFLQQLKTVENMMSATAMCQSVLVPKDKMGIYSHITI